MARALVESCSDTDLFSLVAFRERTGICNIL